MAAASICGWIPASVRRGALAFAPAACLAFGAVSAGATANLAFFQNSYEIYDAAPTLLYTRPLSDWGSVDLSYVGVSGEQYFNLVVDGTWRIVNMPLGAYGGVGNPTTVTFNFALGNGDGTAVTTLDFGFAVTDIVLDAAPVGGLDANVGVRFISGGPSEGGIPWFLPAAGGALAGAMAAAAGVTHADFPNQECGLNKCVPVSVSNSLQWLNKKYDLKMPADKISSEALAAALGTTDAGTPLGWWVRKEQYLKDNKLPVTQTVTESIEEAMKAIAAGKDVEMGAGGHRAAIVGITKLKDGTYEVSVAHDTDQTKDGGTKIEKGKYDPATMKLTGITFMEGAMIRNFVVEAAVIPEPATWAMLIFGFGLAGWRLRRSRGTIEAVG
jgi:PEP-CTERM motif